MKVEYINPFVKAATEVLERETGMQVGRGDIYLHRSAYTTQEVTVLIGVTGDVRGVVLFCLGEKTARAIAGAILGQEFAEFDDLAQSGISEVGNVITGAAGVNLADAGFKTNISPPTLLIGNGTMVSTVDLPRLVIPIKLPVGALEIHVALQG